MPVITRSQFNKNKLQVKTNNIVNIPNVNVVDNNITNIVTLFTSIINNINRIINNSKKYVDFVVLTYNRTISFSNNLKSCIWSYIDKNIIKNFNKSKFEFEEKPKLNRPQRNIPRVDYTGMDMIEPLDEFADITDIWDDLTLHKDPDYEFEEDEYDEDDY
jgi:hypothetical protein